jgi:MFS superfamily sulfate permease-like transporter
MVEGIVIAVAVGAVMIIRRVASGSMGGRHRGWDDQTNHWISANNWTPNDSGHSSGHHGGSSDSGHHGGSSCGGGN